MPKPQEPRKNGCLADSCAETDFFPMKHSRLILASIISNYMQMCYYTEREISWWTVTPVRRVDRHALCARRLRRSLKVNTKTPL